MLKAKQKIGNEHSLVTNGIAEPLDNDIYKEIIYRRSIPLSQDVVGFEKWTEDEELRNEGKMTISKEYEKLHGDNNLLPISFLQKGNERSKAVCRIVTPGGLGTGFLISGGYVMTNNHVVESLITAELSHAEFFYEEGREAVKAHLKPQELFVTNEKLDYTIIACELEKINDVASVNLAPNVANISRGERVSIIQHPRGRQKEVALQDNEVTYVYDKVIHYRTDTEVGTSGSPVFNKEWNLVALHHAGWYDDEKKTQATNEGISINTIVSDLKKISHSNSVYRESANKVLNSIDESSPVLGFFDINGLVDYKDVDNDDGYEVEIPSYRGTKQFADIGFWNIKHFNNDVSNSRVKKVADVVANLSLDALGLVEVEEKAIKKLIDVLRRRGISMKYEYLNAMGAQDLAILYDEITTEVKLRDDINKKYLDTGLLSRKTARGKTAFPRRRYPLFVECKVKNNDEETKFLMIVVHLKAFGDSISRNRRKLASNILTVIIEDLRRNENIPIVLGGDFNQKLDNSGVLNSLTKAPDLFTLTIDDSKDNAITYVGDHHRSLIDHIIVSNDVELGKISNDDAAIVRLDKNIAKFSKDISDHVPVVCRIIYSKEHPQIIPTNHRPNQIEDDFTLGKLSASQNKDMDSLSYYNPDEDKKDFDEYYKGVIDEDFTTNEFFFSLRELLDSTHINRYSYRTARLKYLYPIVDLRENGKLKSIYKIADDYFEVEEVMQKDFELEQELRRGRESTTESELELEALEAFQPFNCEHVVCQSWFNHKEPMKSDLHHLFTCESGCNSSRGNRKYFDFSHYSPEEHEGLRRECGFGQNDQFEPENGKGAVARATLYFLLRYPRVINAYTKDDIITLLQWHEKFPVSRYELHRNREIFKIQGNRNPFIDLPKKTLKVNLELGLR